MVVEYINGIGNIQKFFVSARADNTVKELKEKIEQVTGLISKEQILLLNGIRFDEQNDKELREIDGLNCDERGWARDTIQLVKKIDFMSSGFPKTNEPLPPEDGRNTTGFRNISNKIPGLGKSAKF